MGFCDAVASAGPYDHIPKHSHTNTSSLNFYRPDALCDAQPTGVKALKVR